MLRMTTTNISAAIQAKDLETVKKLITSSNVNEAVQVSQWITDSPKLIDLVECVSSWIGM